MKGSAEPTDIDYIERILAKLEAGRGLGIDATDADEIRGALEEIDRLRARIAELEEQVAGLEPRRIEEAGPEPELKRETIIPWIKWYRTRYPGTALAAGRDEACRRLGITPDDLWPSNRD